MHRAVQDDQCLPSFVSSHLSGADCIQCTNSVYADGGFQADDFRSAAASGLAALARYLVISRRIGVGAC
jgi:hypothetical protein